MVNDILLLDDGWLACIGYDDDLAGRRMLFKLVQAVSNGAALGSQLLSILSSTSY